MPAGTRFRWPWRRRGEIVRAVDEELEFHLTTRAAELERDGHSPAEARRRAVAEFGDLEGTRSYCAGTDWEGERSIRRIEWWEEIRQDLSDTLRTLRKGPGFAAAVIVPLALGVGATASVGAVIRSVLLAPLPYRDPGALVVVEQFMPANPATTIGAMSPPNYLDVRSSVPGFVAAGAYYDNEVTLTGMGAPARVTAPALTPSGFTALGVPPALGRAFAEGEGTPGQDHLTILSHALWVRRFGADSTVIGRSILLDGEPYAVVGVMPAGFDFPVSGADLWLPLGWDASVASQRGAQYLGVVGRLRPGVGAEQLEAQLQSLSSRLIAAYPDHSEYLGFRARPLTDVVVGDTRRPLLLLGAAAALLVLIAGANVTNLLLARVNGRSTELAVRAALGAGRRRLERQILTETVVLGVLGGIAGAALAAVGLAGFVRLWPGLLPRQETVSLGLLVPAGALLVSVITGFLAGLGPARQAGRGELSERLRAGKQSQGGKDLRLRRTLVAAELALATVLLTGAVLLINAIGQLRRVDPGFHAEEVVTFRVQLPSISYSTGEAIGQFYADLLDGIARVPGINGAAATMSLPLSGGGFGGTFTSPTPTAATDPEDQRAQIRVVTRDYFRVMGIPVRAGRSFEPSDRRGGPPVLVVSEGFSKRFWPGAVPGAVGKSIRAGVRPDRDRIEGEIVGVVGDVRAAGLHRDAAPTIYAVTPQVTTSQMTFVVRTAQPTGTVIAAARALLEARDRDIVLDEIATMPEIIGRSLGRPRFIMELLGLFAGLAVVLATVGIYGVVSYAVAQRTREIGVRMALGAEPGQVTRTVLLEEIRWAAAGLVVGAAVTVAGVPLLAGAVFGINPAAPLYQVGAAAALLVVAAVACVVPARRAARVSPLSAIR